jgi:predicted secreted protein
MVTDLASGWPSNLRVGQQLTARLSANRAAGGRWTMRAGSDGGIVAPEDDPSYEATPGGGVEVFRLKAIKSGATMLTFDYATSPGQAAVKSASYRVTVQ